MKQKNLPEEMVAIHRNYFEYLKRQRKTLITLQHKVGNLLWFIVDEKHTYNEIRQKIGEEFPAWRHTASGKENLMPYSNSDALILLILIFGPVVLLGFLAGYGVVALLGLPLKYGWGLGIILAILGCLHKRSFM